MRQKIVAGNWKMNLRLEEAKQLVAGFMQVPIESECRVILAPPYPYLPVISGLMKAQIKSYNNLFLAAQNAHQETAGAFTGEVSPEMLNDIGCTYVILGHSERRQYFGEDNELLLAKLRRSLAAGLLPIYCVGETLEEREAGNVEKVIGEQLEEAILQLPTELFRKCVIAYEPVWAIGTGKTASPEQAQEVHALIRNTVAGKFGEEVAQNTSILYGGSVKPGNAKELFGQPDIDGGLIGGASLKAADFAAICNATD